MKEALKYCGAVVLGGLIVFVVMVPTLRRKQSGVSALRSDPMPHTTSPAPSIQPPTNLLQSIEGVWRTADGKETISFVSNGINEATVTTEEAGVDYPAITDTVRLEAPDRVGFEGALDGLCWVLKPSGNTLRRAIASGLGPGHRWDVLRRVNLSSSETGAP